MEAVKVPKPQWRLIYLGKDISRDIAPMMTEVIYTDHVHGRSDEIEVMLEDGKGQWRGAWYPTKGDQIELAIGYEGVAMVPCGVFKVDELEMDGPPDRVRLKGVAAPVDLALRTKRTAGYENTTLKEIAAEIAERHGLELVGEVLDMAFDRVTQNQERDLEFLKRLAEEHGQAFSVRGKKLIVIDLTVLDAADPVESLDRSDLTRYQIRDKTHQVYKKCIVSYHDDDRKTLIEHCETAEDVESGDTLRLRIRCENLKQAETKAQAALKQRNRLRTQGSITLAGRPRLVAGNNITITGLGRISGKYQVKKSVHRISKAAGYGTTAEVHRV